jgi:hypoxanthine phosphoribosyltransferase
MPNRVEVLIPAEKIQVRVAEVAQEILRDYADKPLTVVGVLTGCLVFLADLIRHLDHPLRIALVQAASYRGTTSGDLTVRDELLPDLTGQNVLLIDDILDTGKTIKTIIESLKAHGAANVKVAVLLHKQGTQIVPISADFVGFSIPDRFVVGYGLDYNDEYRNLPYIGVLHLDSSEAK